MINKLQLTNTRTNDTIVIDKEGSTNYVLDKLEIEDPKIEPETYRVPNQVGESYSGATVGKRGVNITGYVIASFKAEDNVLGMTWNEYYSMQQQKIEEAKDKLNNLIGIRDIIRITIGDVYLVSRPETIVTYSTKEKENNEVLCLFEISLICYDPLFKKVFGSAMSVNSIEKKFKFPMILIEKETLFGLISTGARTVRIICNSDETIGFKLILNFYADFNNGMQFQVTSITTGEKMMIRFSDGVEVKSGDYVIINTKVGEEDIRYHVALTGEEKSIISSLVMSETTSNLPRLQKGVNYLAFSTLENINCRLEYDEGVYNIKEL